MKNNEIRKLLEEYRRNPSNGVRHEQGVIDFIDSEISLALKKHDEELREKIKEVGRKNQELHGGYDDADYLFAYELAIYDILQSLLH